MGDDTTLRKYSGYGCTLVSDLDLSLPAPTSEISAPPDVILRRSNLGYDGGWAPAAESVVSRHHDAARGHSYVSARVGEGYRIRFDGVCEFDINPALDQILWRIAPGADAELVPLIAAGAVLSFRFMLAGDLVLHCSAVTVEGKGLAFVGRSGMGKSTMAALMCAAGGSLVTDDVGRVRWENGGPVLAVGGRESRLRASARNLAALAPRSSVRRTRDERLAVSFERAPLDLAPLDAIVVPMPVRGRPGLELRALPMQEAVLALSAFPRLAGLSDARMIAHQFGQIVGLAKRVPVFTAAIPWDSAPGPHLGAELVKALGWAQPATRKPVHQGIVG